jgi:DNA-binding MarR family transcriptional regulator
MEVGQFSLLATLRHAGEMSQRQLAVGLGMDSSSLTRTLAILTRQGWIEKRVGADRRSRVFSITPDGSEQFMRALPHWRGAQQRFRDIVGEARGARLTELVNGAAADLHHMVRDSASGAGTLPGEPSRAQRRGLRSAARKR